MTALLLEIKHGVEQTRKHTDSLSVTKKRTFEKRYDALLKQGFQANPLPKKEIGLKRKEGGPNNPPRRICWIDWINIKGTCLPLWLTFGYRLTIIRPSEISV